MLAQRWVANRGALRWFSEFVMLQYIKAKKNLLHTIKELKKDVQLLE